MKNSEQLRWQLKDLVDLEYFLKQPSEEPLKPGSSDGFSDDRRFFLAYEKNHHPPLHRRDLIRYWLEEKRKKTKTAANGPAPLPGDAYSETVRLFRSLIIILSFISGAALAWSVLSYSGSRPINIFTCIWVLIVPQFILMAALTVSVIFSVVGFSYTFNGLYPLLASFIRRFAKRAQTVGDRAVSADHRMRLYALSGLIGHRKTIYGSVFFWPVFILAQIFGLCFNLGLLGASLLKLSITDLAFGWQSTLIPSPETVYRIIEIFSLPWSWIASAHPTIEQIQGSRMILKEGMMHLATPDLVSWWPFLCFAILCYGLLPRVLFLSLGIWQQNRAIKRVSFTTGDCDRLIQRMKAPHVQSSGKAYTYENKHSVNSGRTNQPFPDAEATAVIDAEPCLILVPEDIDGQFNDEDLKERIDHMLGLKSLARIRVEMDPEADMASIDNAVSRHGADLSAIRLVVLAEAWQPPIRETISWLTGLRNAVGKETGVIIALVGKPYSRMMFTSPDNTDRVIWEKAVNSLGDPFMRVENLGGR